MFIESHDLLPARIADFDIYILFIILITNYLIVLDLVVCVCICVCGTKTIRKV